MALEVLVGLIYIILELYLDDIIVFADTEEQFLERLEAVYIRLKSKRITLNPKKCEFGLSEIEFVGHTINSTGISFSREKLQEVVTFRAMATQKELRSFLGLGNYFRDHVANFSTKMQPLNELLRDYDKRRRLVWSDESRKAFEDMKTAVHECPTLFFMDETLPVFLHTDASKYGIGAYLFQIDKEGNEKPIAFINKSLTDTQRRWHTPQKEAYAIVYAFKQLDYLIRGVKFTLRTDHKNLIYINDTMTEMVIRWKIAVQDYDFDIEHIPGVDNIVADGLS
jgi:cleavage and polyadenylation specificity factor subunit 1